eukprot:9472870-Pyramimonas_sp.AAC.1
MRSRAGSGPRRRGVARDGGLGPGLPWSGRAGGAQAFQGDPPLRPCPSSPTQGGPGGPPAPPRPWSVKRIWARL